jgi:regulator of sirC expression with transglutaminase-like and TPR domain
VSFDPLALLRESGQKEDSDLNLMACALAFSALAHPGLSTDRHFNHIAKISRDAGERHRALIEAGSADDAGARLAALKHILYDREGYEGDRERYDDLQNADLCRVIDRRKGLPVALCMLYIHAGRQNGWRVDGLNFPGHFLARIETGGQRLIFDPFNGCAVLDAAGLRRLLKNFRGEKAELLSDYYAPCGNREMLLRLQNNIKLRQIEAEDYAAALQTVEWMRLAAPLDYRLMLDAGVLYAKTGRKGNAIEALASYIAQAPDARDRADAARILSEIRLMP